MSREGAPRSPLYLAALAGGALAVSTVMGIGLPGCKGPLHALFGGTPHSDVQANIQTALDGVGVPDESIVLDGTGSYSAKLSEAIPSDIPLVTNASRRNASNTRRGEVQIFLNRTALSWKHYLVSGNPGNSKNYGVEAIVDPAGLTTKKASMVYVKGPDGRPIVHADDALPAQIGGLAAGNTDDIRIGVLADDGDQAFQNDCSDALRKVLKGGIGRSIQLDLLGKAGALSAAPGEQAKATILTDLAGHPVPVIFQYSNGIQLTPDQIQLPKDYLVNNVTVAQHLGKSPDEVQINVNGGKGCQSSDKAVADQIKLIEAANTADNAAHLTVTRAG